jgi:hypothetical protein
VVIDQDYLDELHASADEIAADLEEREQLALDDPIAGHDALMAALRPAPIEKKAPAVILKRHDEARVMPRQLEEAGDLSPDSTALAEAVGDALAQLRSDCADMIDAATADLRERVATFEGQLGMLMTLLGGNSERTFEASEVVRKLKVR